MTSNKAFEKHLETLFLRVQGITIEFDNSKRKHNYPEKYLDLIVSGDCQEEQLSELWNEYIEPKPHGESVENSEIAGPRALTCREKNMARERLEIQGNEGLAAELFTNSVLFFIENIKNVVQITQPLGF